MNKSVQIGPITWDPNEMKNYLKDFLEVYSGRPVLDNHGGQKAAQLFYSWFVAKKMKPDIIIESGVFKGQGTWAFENASPESKIICLDPYLKNYQGYRSQKAQYIELDFKQIDWSSIENKTNVLCFFDDHQNAFERVIQSKMNGFKYLMFEDNYPEGQGDCISLKKVLEFPENYSILPGFTARDYLEKVVDRYQELPPIFSLETTRWNTSWDSYRSNTPLVLSDDDQELSIFKNEMDQYTWINYVELK